MMNEREKSDPAVVAGKSANEPGQPGQRYGDRMCAAEARKESKVK
jgi:hypothetical protein